MEITCISEYKGETHAVELNGGKKLYINKSVVEKFSLREGMELTVSELERIKDADVLRKAKKRGLYLLGDRMMCRKELFSKLKATYGEEIAEQAVEYIDELGYINDEEYAPKLAEHLISRKHWGLYRVRQEMLHRGLDRELVENILAEFSDDDLDEELIGLIERRYIGKIADPDDRRRTTAALMRRGFGFSSIKRCVEYVIEDNGLYDDEEDQF